MGTFSASRKVVPSRMAAGLLAAALGAAACGSSAPEDASSPADSQPTAAATQPTAAATEPTAATTEPIVFDRADVDPMAPVSELAAGFNDAGFNLFKTQPVADNLVLSPTSIGHALLMARAAADDATGQSIDTGFSLPAGLTAHDAWNSIDQMIEASNGAQTSLAGEPSPIVTVADRIWPRLGLDPSQDWIDLLASHHGSDVQAIDVGAPEQSRQEINQWVSDQTNKLIPSLLPEGFIDDSTLLVLTDAVYFKAQWQTVFAKYGTVEDSFTNLDSSRTPTEFMVALEQGGPRAVADRWSAAELAYLGGDYSMLVIVPDDFEAMRDELSQALLDEIDAATESGPYELLLPKWETESAVDLIDWLGEMGAAPGSYPGIDPSAFLGGAVHGAVISVDDVGTEAAAATALDFDTSGPPEPEFTIAVDKPFFYVIRHVESGLVLFAGQVTNL